MKVIVTIILLICLNFTASAQQGCRLALSAGIPVNKLTDWKSFNIDIDFLLSKKVSKHSLLGVGSSYLVVDLLQSNTFFTFDRSILSIFGSYQHEVSLSEKIKLLPQLRIGYSFISSELNQFPDGVQKTAGLYIAEEVYCCLSLSENIDLLAGGGLSTVFSSFKTSPDLIVPNNYIGNTRNTINQFTVRIGGAYMF